MPFVDDKTLIFAAANSVFVSNFNFLTLKRLFSVIKIDLRQMQDIKQ